MEFYSILYPSPAHEARAKERSWPRPPEKRPDARNANPLRGNKFFRQPNKSIAPSAEASSLLEDIRLDQVIGEALHGDLDRDLMDDFCTPCPDERTVLYRHAVMRALEDAGVLAAFENFCRSAEQAVRTMDLSKQVHHSAQRDKFRVDGVSLYAEAIDRLLGEAPALRIESEGLHAFLNALKAYADQPEYRALKLRTLAAKIALERIQYRLRVRDGKVALSFGAPEDDLARSIARDFGTLADPFAAEDGAAGTIRLFGQLELCPLEALVMNALERRYTRQFQDLRAAAAQTSAIPEPFVIRFVRDMRFYFRYLDLMRRMRERGYPFSLPSLMTDGSVRIEGAYDLALALQTEHAVPNDLFLTAEERGVVIAGANQAGKTTYLRSVGQVAVLTALGLPVPCEQARLPLYRSVYSHFGKADDSSVDHGKLKEELVRLKPALHSADRDSLVLLNEPFSSTTAQDAMDMANCALSMLMDAGARVLCVTHIGGLAPARTVSMAPEIDPVSHQRLYRITRAPAETHALADEVAQKYHLTYREIKERILHGV